MNDEYKAKLLAACRKLCDRPEDDESIRDVFEVVFECPVNELPNLRVDGLYPPAIGAVAYATGLMIP